MFAVLSLKRILGGWLFDYHLPNSLLIKELASFPLRLDIMAIRALMAITVCVIVLEKLISVISQSIPSAKP